MSVTFLLCILPLLVKSFPTGIGSCDSGIAAVNQGAHASLRQLDGGGGGIGLAGFEVLIDGDQVYEDIPFAFTAGVVHTIQLVATGDIMRGFLLRLESSDGQDTTMALNSDDSQVEVPYMCTEWANVGGLSHTNNYAKQSIQGSLYMPFPTSSAMTLGVTAVVSTEYSLGTAEFYYTGFTLNAVAQGTNFINQAPPSNTMVTSSPSVQCDADATICYRDGACCSGRCIREDTQDLYANGYCLSTGTDSSYQAPEQDYAQGTPQPTVQATPLPTTQVSTAPTPQPIAVSVSTTTLPPSSTFVVVTIPAPTPPPTASPVAIAASPVVAIPISPTPVVPAPVVPTALDSATIASSRGPTLPPFSMQTPIQQAAAWSPLPVTLSPSSIVAVTSSLPTQRGGAAGKGKETTAPVATSAGTISATPSPVTTGASAIPATPSPVTTGASTIPATPSPVAAGASTIPATPSPVAAGATAIPVTPSPVAIGATAIPATPSPVASGTSSQANTASGSASAANAQTSSASTWSFLSLISIAAIACFL